MRPLRYSSGAKIGKWTLLQYLPIGKESAWLAKCDCGTEKQVRTSNLISWSSFSCGCERKSRLTHGHASGNRTPEYRAWQSMRKRCSDKNDKAYHNYGGRGINVCDRWSKFENFIADMGIKPSPEHSLDRVNNDGNYEPSNCRWATYKQQTKNRRPFRALKNYTTEELLDEIWSRGF